MTSGAENIFDRELYLARLERTKLIRPDILSTSPSLLHAPAMNKVSETFDYDVAILGGGSAGYAAARTAASAGLRTVVISIFPRPARGASPMAWAALAKRFM